MNLIKVISDDLPTLMVKGEWAIVLHGFVVFCYQPPKDYSLLTLKKKNMHNSALLCVCSKSFCPTLSSP